ncbi:hypothetical protein POVWA2_076110 [Plasmodium ovale wallikeri]|uniref:Uncharacterized protein n=1 Tax=Plasmodium ovale wallikeri TaxID=864142 RepID=A0A1A9AK95_PLAOA|nr:hypothetical protein POVWA1_077190 [Plasmodium ovale wallikeri]SBT56922.1 hypothetical protein POVWA2_076110 [Plasmodium ovale wallikeri]
MYIDRLGNLWVQKRMHLRLKKEKKKTSKEEGTNKRKNEANQIPQENALNEGPLQIETNPNVHMQDSNFPFEIPKDDSLFEKHIVTKLGINTQGYKYISVKRIFHKIIAYTSLPSFVIILTAFVIIAVLCSLQAIFIPITNVILIPYIILKSMIYPLLAKYKNKNTNE